MAGATNYLLTDLGKDIILILQAIVIVFGIPIALYNIRAIARGNRMQSTSHFLDYLEATRDERRHLYQNCNFSNPKETSEEDEICAKSIIDSFNRIAVLIENDMLDPELVFSTCHTVVIRCWYRLEPYARYQETLIGGRYARRVERLFERAKKFHDIRPHQRIHPIRISFGDQSIIVYETFLKTGIRGFLQRITWSIRYFMRIY